MQRPYFTHAGIYVHDLNGMARFYKEVLDLIESDRGRGVSMPADLVFLTADPTIHHQFVLVARRAAVSPSTVNQLSFKINALEALREVGRRARERGASDIRFINHGNAWSVYFLDPEGNTVEVYMDTPWYVSQPHGDRLDIDLPDEEIRRRTEAMCREDPRFMPVEEWQAQMRGRLAPSGKFR